jgi:tetratricopeptide (TPR) repeat protein
MLARAHEAHDVEAVRELAGEILGPDYLDDDRRPRELAPGRPVLDAGIQARAHLERAWALATAARPAELAGSHQVWSQVELSLAEVDRLIGDAPELVDALPRTRWLTTRAALLIARNRPGEAVELLKPLPSLREITKDTCTALLLCADAQRTLGYPRVAEELLLRAYRLAEELGDTGTTAQIALILADHATERGRYDEATTWARRSAGTPLPPLALATGLPSTAARLAEGSTATQAAALRALGCPSEAVEVCQLALEPPLQPTDPARIRFETGLAAAELLNLDYALWQLLLARKNYFTRQDLEAAACCSAEAAVICLRQAGNLAQAEQYVNEGLRLTLEVGSAGWTRLHLGRVELLHHLGHPERASEECAQVFDVLHATAGHPTLQISAALHGLAFGAADEPRFHDVLHQNLARISPVGARLAALAELALHPGPLDLSAHVPAPLITSANDAIAAPDEFDTAWQTLRMAEVYRLAGQRERAVDRLARGTRVLVKREQTAWWPWLRAMERIGPASPGEFVPPALPGTAPPLLVAAYEVTLAQRRIALDARSVTEARVRRARELLEGMTRITKWHALLEEVATQLAASAGDGDEVQHRRDAARAVYRQLGDELAVADPASEDELAGRELTVHLELDHGRLGIQAGGDPVEIIPECAVLAAALCEKYRSTSTVPVLNHLVKELRSTNRLPAFAHLDPHLPLEGTPPVDVRMTLAPPLLAQVPWELAPAGSGTLATDPRVGVIYRVPNETRAVNVQTMALQRALQRAGFDPGHIDGLAGPLTREAVRAFQRSAGRPADGIAGRHTWAALLARLAALVPARRPRVLILRREADAELSIQRGWHVSGYDLKSLYRRASWDVLSATGADIAERGQWFNGAAADPIDVLHVSTTMDVTQTVPHLSFGVGGPMDDGSSELPQTLAVTVLDRLVQQIATAGTVPLVVLDIAAPPRVSELLRQLLARNDFAHQMVALGHVETVLATAGSPPQLVELLTGGRTAAQIAGELHSAARHATSLEELLIGAGTALVSSIRPAVMVPLPQA